jgi:hypothetical protein
MSDINYLSINEQFPVPGQDNDTQVFRDNFDTIKTSLRYAKEEITDLQNNGSRTDVDNDYNNKVQTRAIFQNTLDKSFDGGSPPVSSLVVDYENGNYQIFRLGQNTNIEFLNFPDDDTIPEGVGKVTLELYSDGSTRTITFSVTGGTQIKKNSSFPGTFTLTSADSVGGAGNPVIIEVWKHSSDKLFLNYLGQFS